MKHACFPVIRAAALLGLLAVSAGIAPVAFAQAAAHADHGAPVDRLGIPGPVRFGDTRYALAWSSHPSADLYKQEYLPAGQTLERYDSMLMVDLAPNIGNAVRTAAGMIETLNARKATDPLVNHDLLVKDDGSGALLDFLMSSADASGVIVEWNAYRYTDTPDGRGTQMTGISRRAYGDTAARALLTGLKESRAKDIDTLAQMTIPVATPSQP